MLFQVDSENIHHFGSTSATKTATTTTTTEQFDEYNAINFTTTIEANIQNSSTTFITLNESAFQLINAYDENIIGPSQFNYSSANEFETHAMSLDRTCLVLFFSSLIFITVFGNTLVIVSVITTRRLRTVTNCFVMSLAIADWMVGIFVMPPTVLLYIYGSWKAGWILCEIWISLDILLCTASILSLCAISLDRYLAVTQPLNYKKRRTKRLALIMICVVWIVALCITCPPILGWYEPGRHKSEKVECRYNQNKGYVVFSAMGSFFIPMTVMLYVYSRICCVLTSRHNSMAKTEISEKTLAEEIECDNVTSEYESCQTPQKFKLSKRGSRASRTYSQKSFEHDESHPNFYELVDLSKSSSTLRSSSVSCKYSTCIGTHHHHFKLPSVHFCHSQTSIADSFVSSGRMRVQGNNNGKRMPIRISSTRRETKAAQTLSFVIGGFIACWMPFFVYYLMIPFLPKESVSEIVMSVLTWLGWLNSAINPFIYAFYNADFRIAFWRLTFRKCCKNKKTHLFLKA